MLNKFIKKKYKTKNNHPRSPLNSTKPMKYTHITTMLTN